MHTLGSFPVLLVPVLLTLPARSHWGRAESPPALQIIPFPPVQCQATAIIWASTGNSSVKIIRKDGGKETELERHTDITGESFTWAANVAAGTSIILEIQTIHGNRTVEELTTDPMTIQAGSDDSCLAVRDTASRGRKLATGAIVGIVIGGLVAFVLAAALFWRCRMRTVRRGGVRKVLLDDTSITRSSTHAESGPAFLSVSALFARGHNTGASPSDLGSDSLDVMRSDSVPSELLPSPFTGSSPFHRAPRGESTKVSPGSTLRTPVVQAGGTRGHDQDATTDRPHVQETDGGVRLGGGPPPRGSENHGSDIYPSETLPPPYAEY